MSLVASCQRAATPPTAVAPRTPEKPRTNDCPITLPDEQTILPNLTFPPGKSDLSPSSCCTLRGVAALLESTPRFTRVAIEVHSDERGPEAYNAELSQKRADAIVENLVHLGVPRSRLHPVGIGELCPIDPAHNEKAWAKNRRVVLTLLETDGESHGRQPSCDAKPASIDATVPKVVCD
jgi:outer membrane protein OmpA-like peptidoglycan-associated protein